MGTFFEAFWGADFFGKMIFFGLFALSIVSWVFLTHKVWLFYQIRKNAKGFESFTQKNKDKLLNIDSLSESQLLSHPFGYLYIILKEKTTEILDKNHFFSSEHKVTSNYLSHTDVELIDSHLQTAITKQKEFLEKNLFILSMTVTLAPFLGLLGTVWGILTTFGQLQAGHTIASSAMMLGGLSTALTTTVLGLLIAIPAIIANNYLRNLSRYFTIEMHDYSHFLLSTVEIQYRKVDIN